LPAATAAMSCWRAWAWGTNFHLHLTICLGLGEADHQRFDRGEPERLGALNWNRRGWAEGLRRGDRIVSLNDEPVREMTDVELIMWDKQPGNLVKVEVKRRLWFHPRKTMRFEATLR
jgi:PDZ domain